MSQVHRDRPAVFSLSDRVEAERGELAAAEATAHEQAQQVAVAQAFHRCRVGGFEQLLGLGQRQPVAGPDAGAAGAGAEYAEIWGEAIHSNRHLRVISVGWRCCVIRARGEPGREAHPPQYTRSDRGIPSSAIRFSTAHLIAASTFWFLTVRAERLTPSIALYRETAFSAKYCQVSVRRASRYSGS